jgi:hypothetical protein
MQYKYGNGFGDKQSQIIFCKLNANSIDNPVRIGNENIKKHN